MYRITVQNIYNSVYNLQLSLSPEHTSQYITAITNYIHCTVSNVTFGTEEFHSTKRLIIQFKISSCHYNPNTHNNILLL